MKIIVGPTNNLVFAAATDRGRSAQISVGSGSGVGGNVDLATVNAAANTVRVSANGGSSTSKKQLNFVNTASIQVSVTDSNDGNANISFTTTGAAVGDAYSQANNARNQANSARDQANTARTTANNSYAEANLKLNLTGGTISGNLIISGNLEVLGNSTTLNVETLIVEDNEIILNGNVNTSPVLNAFISVNRGTSPTVNVKWNESADKWEWTDDGNSYYTFDSALSSYQQANSARDTANGAYSQANGAYAQANLAYGQANAAYDEANTRVIRAGDTMTGNLNVAAWLITQNIVPSLNNTFDLGSPDFKFKDLYVGGNTVYIGDAILSAEGTEVRTNTFNATVSFVSGGLNVLNQANSAYDAANAASGIAQDAYSQANNAYAQANAAYAEANLKLNLTGGTITGNLSITGNLEVLGNSTVLNVESLAIEDNEIILNSNVTGTPTLDAFITINRGNNTNAILKWDESTDQWKWSDGDNIFYAFDSALDAYNQANTARDTANGAYAQANGAYAQANGAYAQANGAYDQANGAYSQANGAYAQANGAYAQANLAYSQANDAYSQANSARNQANAAYNEANLKLNLTGGSINGSLNISGNLFVTGNTSYINVSTFVVDDSLFYLGANNTLSDVVDIGFVGAKNSGPSVTHTGLARDAGDGTWYLFDNLPNAGHENNVIDFANTTLATLRANINANSILLAGNPVATSANTTLAYNQANSARDQANTARDTANGAYGQANGAYAHANIVYNQANTARDQANTARDQANTARNTANNAYDAANNRVLKIGDTMTGNLIMSGATINTSTANISTITTANTLTLTTVSGSNGNIVLSANGTEDMRIQANGFITVGSVANPNSNLTVLGNIWATTGINAAGINATTANITTLYSGSIITTGSGGDITGVNTIYAGTFATTAGLNVTAQAANAYDQANNARDQANTARTQANTARTTANDAYGQANTARDQANTARTTANDAYAQANTARDQANTAYGQANDAYLQANTARDTANDSYGQANVARDTANSAYVQANNAYTEANAAANTVRVYANSGSILSNKFLNFINTASIVVSVSDNFDGNANIAFATTGASSGQAYDQANAAYNQANNAYNAANNAQVTVFANNASSVTTPNINFVNTSTITVSVLNESGNANISFESIGGGGGIESQYNTTTTSAETIDQWSATLYRSAKYQMQVENYLGFLALDIMLLHDGSTTNLVQSSVTTLLGNTGAFSSDISGGMVRLRFTANDPTTALTYYRRSLVSLRGNESLPTDLMTGSSGYDLMEVISISPSDLMNP